MADFTMDSLRSLGLSDHEIATLTGAERKNTFFGPTTNWRKLDTNSIQYKIGFAASVAFSTGEFSILQSTLSELGRIAQSE